MKIHLLAGHHSFHPGEVGLIQKDEAAVGVSVQPVGRTGWCLSGGGFSSGGGSGADGGGGGGGGVFCCS